MPKVSIIIPAFNAMPYLPKALATVQLQTFCDWEVIIVNDGSSDGTEEWAKKIEDSRVRLISQANQGKSAARNRGISDAAGEYIAFLDADDLWEKTKLEKQIKHLDQHSSTGLVYTWTALADQNGIPTGKVINSFAEGQVLADIVQFNILGCGSTPILRRSCFEKVGLFNPDLPLGQDWDMWIRIAAQFLFSVITEPLVLYRQHSANSCTNWRLMEQCQRMILERAFNAHPSELSAIKSKAYSEANLYLSWMAIRSHEVQAALAFWRKACHHSPSKYFSMGTLRLMFAINISLMLGDQNYEKFIVVSRNVRRYFQSK